MTQSRFFQISLLFPVLLWCVGLLAFSFLNGENGGFIAKNMYNAYRVFVPYVIFAAGVWKIAKNRPYGLLVLIAAVVPIVWGIFFTLFYTIVTCLTERVSEPCHILAIMGFWAALVGYLAEAIPFLILAVFKNDFKNSAAA